MSAKRRRSGVQYQPDFLAFWELYPRKVKKADAARAWANEQPSLELIRAALAWQTAEWAQSPIRFTPHAASYVNARRWEDERPAATRAPTPREERNQSAMDGYRALMAQRNGK